MYYKDMISNMQLPFVFGAVAYYIFSSFMAGQMIQAKAQSLSRRSHR